ncbi:peptidase domain-containing ABC transporter [Xenorhabdus bovienii]|uniref:peptidase domain-containing ABC transporter n=1 Tax=Xenorhabdus bovienii TaxID=40576 RepID=UPI003DA3AA0C
MQSEQADCGHACLCMIVGYWGNEKTLEELKAICNTSSRGITLLTLKKNSEDLGLVSKAVKITLDGLVKLQGPAILHWNNNHFVIFERHKKNNFYIIDPVSGRRKLSFEEFKQCFTGFGLFLKPGKYFEKQQTKKINHINRIIKPVILSSLTAIITLSLFLELISLALPYAYGWLIDKVTVHRSASVIIGYLALSLLLIILAIILSLVKNKILLVKGSEFYLKMQEALQKKLFCLPISYFEKRTSGEIAARLDSISYIRRTFNSESSNIISNALLSCFSLAALFFINIYLPIITVVTMLIFLLIRVIVYEHQMYAKNSEYAKAPLLYSIIQETISAMASIKISQSEQNRYQRWLDTSFDAECDKHTYDKYALMLSDLKLSLNNVDQFTSVFIIFGYLWDGSLTIGGVFTYLFIRNFFFIRVTDLILKISEIKLMSVYSNRLNEIICMQDEKNGSVILRSDKSGLAVAVKGLNFRYSPYDDYIFQDLNLTIKEGESIALTGDSGTGKTTLAKILAGFYEQYDGQVEIEGVDLKKINNESYRKQISTVFQNDKLLSGSLIDNICSFEKKPDLERIYQCCALANIDKKIEILPMKYNTFYHTGSDMFSGGELQRLLIARALYKRPKLLIMDESTSHLDVRNESLISENIRLMKMTRIIIAHRTETINSADRIIRIDNQPLN